MFSRSDRQFRLLDLIFWLPTFAGVAVLVAALAFVGFRFLGAPDDPAAVLPAPISPVRPVQPSSPVPADQLGPPGEPGRSDDARPANRSRPAGSPIGPADAPAGRPPARTRPPATKPPATVPAGPVSGTYRVLNSYDDAFIAEVLVATSGGNDQDWTVTLRFPGTVGKLITSWVESAPQATLTVSGSTYTWRSGAPVQPGSSVPLRFHFARSGTGDFPVSCAVNGSACAIRR